MRTPETSSNNSSNRETRNAVFAASAMIFVAFISAMSVLAPLAAGQALPVRAVIEAIVLISQILTAVYLMVQIFRGNVETGIWWLIYSFIIAAAIRILLRESVGLFLGILTAIVVSAAGSLTFPAGKASRANIIGYGAGALIVLIDLYISSFISRQAGTPAVIGAARGLAALIFISQLVVLILQTRTLSLSTKISSYFSLITLIVVAAIGFTSIQIINNWIASGNDVTGFASATLKTLQRGTITGGAIVSFISTLVGVFIATTLTTPLQRLSDTSAQVASGNLEARAPVHSEDEIGKLSVAFNSMADSLQDMVGQLENRVEERTKDLQRRAVQIQAAVEIGHEATSAHDIESLLARTAQLISERFNYYHAGIFLLDPTGENAVLHAASSEGGRKMLERRHSLRIGETGIVGYVTQTGAPRIALDVGQDAVFFDNPDLPETRSEMALPLIASGQILGALDVQSTEEQAFDEEDIATLQIVADQVAIAIRNARLLAESEEALKAVRTAYGDISRDAWTKIIKTQARVSYVSSSGTIQANTNAPGPDVLRAVESGDVITSSDGLTIGVPIKIRGRVIGALRLKKQDTSSLWTHEETALAISLSEQLSGALEGARLYKESQQRAARESLVSDISARISALPHVDTIVRETVQELGQAIGNAHITFSLVNAPENADQVDGPRGNGHEANPPANPKKSDE